MKSASSKTIHAKLSHVALAALMVSGYGIGSASAQSVLDYAGQWKFDTCATSSLLPDSSGNNNSAVPGAFLQCTTGFDNLANGAVNFVTATSVEDSANHSVNYGNPVAHKVTNQFAFSMRIKPSSTGQGALLTKSWSANGQVNRVFQFIIQPNSDGIVSPSIRVWYKNTNGTIASTGLHSSGVVPTGQWTQLGGSYDPVKGLRLFMNGVELNPSTTPLLIPAGATLLEAPTGSTSTLYTGGKGLLQVSGQSFLGAVDDVWFSNGSCADLQSSRVPDTAKELMINSLSVVNDARATGMGPWSFGGLVSQMVPANPSNPQAALDAASDMIENMFRTWDRSTVSNPTSGSTPVVVNGQTLEHRPGIMNIISPSNWPRNSNGKLNLAQAPLRLTAIVNRMDLRSLANGSAGEGRFVFNVLQGGSPTQFTVIMEYNLPAATGADIRKWGDSWHKLGVSTNYNADLQAITDRFSKRGMQFGAPNGNPLNQLRTNEIAIGNPWELRQFKLTATGGVTRLEPTEVALTPAVSFNNTTTLGNYLSENFQAILNFNHNVPKTFVSTTTGVTTTGFLGGAAPLVPNFGMVWNAPNITVPSGVNPEDVRQRFALNTCSGCHQAETNTTFLHVGTRTATSVAPLSQFLTSAPFNDLARRKTDLTTKVLTCPAPGAASPFSLRAATTSSTTSTTSNTTLSQGIRRTH